MTLAVVFFMGMCFGAFVFVCGMIWARHLDRQQDWRKGWESNPPGLGPAAGRKP